MQMTKCPDCKRIVAAERKTRAFSINGETKIETVIRPLVHLSDSTATHLDLCEQKAA
jgi:hypothetical protein